MRIADFGYNHYSQFGEDGIIAHILEVFDAARSATPSRASERKPRFCVEFGAADGVDCSNTKRLRDEGWSGLLLEADPDLYVLLVDQAGIPDRVDCINTYVTTENINHYVAARDVDFMSIDVDGNDYAIFEALEMLPRIVCIEYNASIPPHVSVRQRDAGENFGASAKALCELAADKGYGLVEVTTGNLFFVRNDDIELFDDYERDLDALFDTDTLSYLATDYTGKPLIVGAVPPWGLRSVPFVGSTEGDPVLPATTHLSALRDSFEDMYGTSHLLAKHLEFAVETPDPKRERMFRAMLNHHKHQLLLIDITHQPPTADFSWLGKVADTEEFDMTTIPSGVLAFIPRSLR